LPNAGSAQKQKKGVGAAAATNLWSRRFELKLTARSLKGLISFSFCDFAEEKETV
jgi:hypothetical protein